MIDVGLFDRLENERFARVWMSLPLDARWRTVRTFEEVRDCPLVRVDQKPAPGRHGLLSELSVPNREPVGFRRSWFCELARVC